MLAIRMQRTGRKGHAMFRVVVQDSRRTPSSGKIVAQLGTYDPHAKTVVLDKEKATFYVTHGAQPSPRTARLMKSEGVKLPSWVVISDAKAGALRHPEKLRSNQPKVETTPEEAPVEETPEVPAVEPGVPAETSPEAPTPEAPAEPQAEPGTPAEPEA